MYELGKISEIANVSNKEMKSSISAFENSKNDVKETRHISTINENLVGEKNQGVLYQKHVFRIKGEKVEGVFPKFESVVDIKLPKNLEQASDNEQFRYCTKMLAKRIESDPSLAEKFTPRQLEQIRAGNPRISGLTWHHNEVPGKMQLVDANKHQLCRHTGGKSVWGGGASCR